MTTTILFVIYGGGHAHMVCPVVHRLRESDAFRSGDIAIKVLGLPAAKATLNRNGIECIGFADYLDPVSDADAVAWGTELAKDHHSPGLGIELTDSIAYLGLNYKDLVTRLGKEQAKAAFKEKGRNSFYPLTIMERIFDDIRPDFVVTSNSPRSEAAAIETANRRGINNLAMTDLFTGTGGYKLSAKNVTFINEFAMRMFRADGRVAEHGCQYHYTGNPAFDKLLTFPKDKDKAWLHQKFLRSENRTHVLHADMPAYWHTTKNYLHIKTEAETLEEMEHCYQATLANKAVYLIRPHPSQPRDMYASWLAARPDAYMASGCDLHELLRNVDLVVVRSTTVGIEAAYLEKRVLQLDCSIHTDSPIVELGIAWGVDGYDSLAQAMRTALTDDKRYAEIRQRIPQVFPTTPAAATIASLIVELVHSGPAAQERAAG